VKDRLGTSDSFYEVVAAAAWESEIVVASRSEPFLQFVDGSVISAFGATGDGPAELQTAVDVVLTAVGVTVLDQQQSKLVTFSRDGSHISTRSLDGIWAQSLYIIGRDTVLGTFAPMSAERAVVKLRGSQVDTILTFSRRGERVRLEAPDAPSLTLVPPFTAQHVWTVMADGRIATWDPAEPTSLQLVGDSRTPGSVIPVLLDPLDVTEADRERWLEEQFELEFMGRRPFRPLREEARRRLRFPEHFPRIMQMISDPGGDLWIRNSIAGAGEHWTLLDLTGDVRGRVRLRPGSTLLAVAQAGLITLSTDELGIEMIEVLERPVWASPPTPSDR